MTKAIEIFVKGLITGLMLGFLIVHHVELIRLGEKVKKLEQPPAVTKPVTKGASDKK